MKLFICIIIFFLVPPDNAFSANLNGKIKLTGKQASKAKVENVFVYFEPDNKTKVTPLAAPYALTMKNKSYTPRVSAIPLGSKIKIANRDSILHNAFSPSGNNRFDLGLYGKSAGKEFRFESPGVVRVFCNVHYHMVAYVLVLDTPFFTQVNSDGSFQLDNLPSGGGKLVIWHERSKGLSKRLVLPLSENLEFNLPITRRRIPIHKNKSGRSYKKKRRRRRY